MSVRTREEFPMSEMKVRWCVKHGSRALGGEDFAKCHRARLLESHIGCEFVDATVSYTELVTVPVSLNDLLVRTTTDCGYPGCCTLPSTRPSTALDLWMALEVIEECPDCDGEGGHSEDYGGGYPEAFPCDACDGRGWVATERTISEVQDWLYTRDTGAIAADLIRRLMEVPS